MKTLVLQASEKAEQNKGVLGTIWQDLLTLIELVKAWVTGRYRQVPWQTMVLAVAALLYFVNPFDVVPDVIPLFGFLDDATVIGFVIASIKKDIESFRFWTAGSGEPVKAGHPET